MNGIDSLAALHDIQLPSAIAWWPLAFGWWVLFIAGTVALIVVFFGARQFYLKHRLRQLVLSQIDALAKAFEIPGAAPTVMARVSRLLKQIVLLDAPRSEVAHLHGEAWLTYLNTRGKTSIFTEKFSFLLLEVPYGAVYAEPASDFFEALKRFAEKVIK